MQCTSCAAEIPDDSIFCTECGSRQDLSRASPNSQVGLGGGEVSGGRGFGVVSGEAIMAERDSQQQPQGQLPSGMVGMLNQQPSIPQAIDPAFNQMPPMQEQPPMNQVPQSVPDMQQQQQQTQSILDQMSSGFPPLDQGLPGIAQNQQPMQPVADPAAGGMPSMAGVGDPMLTPQSLQATYNPSVSPTDEMVNRLSIAEKEIKNERRSQWLQMNQESASSVLAQISGELPAHLQEEKSKAAEFLKGAIGAETEESKVDRSLLRRMAEVSVRRVARKRGVAVETPQSRSDGDLLVVNVTYVDDGRVLDTPEDLAQAFQHAISTELALKGIDMSADINLYRSKDGDVELVHGNAPAEDVEEEEEEMFACEMCGGLVAESDSKCNHCGAVFEEEDEPASSGPPGPGSRRGGPPGPGGGGSPRGGPGGPGGPSRGGPPGRGGGPGGPSRGGPPGSGGGPPGRGGGPPGGPSRGGPPGSGGGPPGRGGGPPGGPSRGGPSGSGGGPPGRGGGPPGGPSRGGPPGSGGGPPGRGGGPPGRGGGPPGGPSKGGPPGSGGGPPGRGGGPPGRGGGGPPKGPRKGPPR